MSKKIILPLLTLIISLLFIFLPDNNLIESKGDINTLTIISSDEDWKESEHIIRYFFESKFIKTPQTEYIYNINWSEPSNLNQSTIMKNILFLSLSHPADSTIDLLTKRILREHNIQSDIAIFSDLFAKKQKVVLLRLTDTIDLEKQLETYYKSILSEYDNNIYENYYNYLIGNDSHDELEELLNNKFKLSIFIQEDYRLISQTDDFVWIGRGYPYRWLIFKKIKKLADINNPYLYFDDIIQNHDLGIIINNEYRDKMTLLGNETNIRVYRGVYNHIENNSGGPFALYMLDNVYNDEVILVASIINNPGKSKISHILQMDALISNIKF